MFIEQLINGIGQGAIYALMSIGYALIFGVIGLVTFAHGDVIMFGCFAAYFSFLLLGDNLLLAILSGFLISAAMGFVIHRVCYNRFFTSPRQIALVCTIGMGMFMRNSVQVAVGTESRAIPNLFGNGALDILGCRVGYMKLFTVAVVVLMAAALTVFLNRTHMGLALKAVSMDKTASSLVGIDTKRVTTLGNVIGCGLAGVAGVLLAMYYGTISPTMGGALGMKCFCCAVLGGMSSIGGAAVGGLLIGIFENLGIMIFPAGFRDVVSFACLFVILLIKPEGLFGRKER
ncbi:MAG: branched-chain amino acid ABC transporter permease [Oscillospiraceae bacterium]|nr:branched-chain amino acid ABC transporter permease [Oscillospiraceae bacterium]